MLDQERRAHSADPVLSGIGAFLVAVGVLIVGVTLFSPRSVGAMFDESIKGRYLYPIALAIAGASLLWISARLEGLLGWLGRIGLMFSISVGVAGLLPGLVGSGFVRIDSWNGTAFGLMLSVPFLWLALGGASALIVSFERTYVRAIGIAIALLFSSLLATLLLTIGWFSPSLVRDDSGAFGGFVLVGLTSLALLSAGLRTGWLKAPVALRPIMALPWVVAASASAVCVLRLASSTVSESAAIGGGVLVAALLLVLVSSLQLAAGKSAADARVRELAELLSLDDVVLGHGRVGAWSLAREGERLILSARAQQIVGAEELPYAEDFAVQATEAFEGKGAFCSTVEVIGRGSAKKYFELCGGPVYGPDRSISQLVGLVRDVTAEIDELRRSQARTDTLELVTSAVIDLVFLYDIRKRAYVYMSSPRDGVLAELSRLGNQQNLTSRVFDDDREGLMKYLGQIESSRDDDVLTHECRFLDAKGHVHWLELRNRAVVWDEDGRACVIRGTIKDVTWRVERDSEMHDKSIRLKSLVSGTPGIVFRKVQTGDGRISFPFFSDASSRIIGISAEEAMSDPARVFERIHVEDRESFFLAQEQSTRELTPLAWDGRVYGPDNEVKWVHIRATPGRELDGSIVCEGVALDVTDAHTAQEALERTSARLDFLQEESPTVVYSCSGTEPYEVQYVGPNVRNLFGHFADRIIGSPLFEIEWLDQESEEVFAEHRQRFIDRGHSAAEYQIVGASGKPYWVRDEVHLVSRSEDTYEVIGSWTDVTPLRSALEDLRNSETRLKMLEDCVPFVSFSGIVVDGRFAFSDVGSSALNVLGIDPSSVLQDPSVLFDVFEPGVRATLVQSLVEGKPSDAPLRLSGAVALDLGRCATVTALATKHAAGTVAWDGVILIEPTALPRVVTESASAIVEPISRESNGSSTERDVAKKHGQGDSKRNGHRSVVAVSRDPDFQSLMTHIAREKTGLTLKFAATAGQGLELCYRERPDLLVFIDAVSDDVLLKVIRAVRQEKTLLNTRIAIQRAGGAVNFETGAMTFELGSDAEGAIRKVFGEASVT